MKLSDSIIKKINQFEQSKEVRFSSIEMDEFKKFCQEVFRFSIDTSCRSCVCQYVNKTIVYLKQ